MPVGRTVGKLKEHLADIYRAFIRDGQLELRFGDEPLSYQAPAVLTAPYFRDPTGSDVEWSKPIEFDLGDGLTVQGFAALREKANTAKAGFSLFRRGRVVTKVTDRLTSSDRQTATSTSASSANCIWTGLK
jgi:hypothetical protein